LVKYLLKRILILIPVILAISVLLFTIGKLMPGDPVRAMLPPTTALRPEQYQLAYDAMYRRLGLDKGVVEQYFRWFGNLIRYRDLGYSSIANRPVADAIKEPLKNTLMLNVFVNFFYLLIALPLGIKMAVKRGSIYDTGIQVASIATYSIPSFFMGLSLIYIFAITFPLLPAGGMPNTFLLGAWTWDSFKAWARHLTLPVAALTLMSLASALRYVRNAMIDALSQDYIRTARSKGLGEKVVIYSHALRNAMIPISTVIVMTLFSLFAGATVTESIFAYNGIGRLLLRAVTGRDTALITSLTLFFAVINIIAVLAADIIYGLVDPRIKLE